MTVQFILPEATSFPKERKLHGRLFLVLLYNLLCNTFKDHSSTFAASLRSERNSLLQERCFPIASAKVEHFCIPCKTSPKKNARKIHLHPFCYFIALQNRQLSPFFRFTPSLRFPPQNRRFLPISAALGAKTTFCGVFFSSVREKFSPEISVFAEKISLTGCFCLEFARISTLAGEEKEKVGVFLPPPPLRSKNTSRLSLQTSPLFATSSLVSLKTSLPRTKSHSILRAGHAPTRIYAHAHSPNLPFLPSPFTSPRNKL